MRLSCVTVRTIESGTGGDGSAWDCRVDKGIERRAKDKVWRQFRSSQQKKDMDDAFWLAMRQAQGPFIFSTSHAFSTVHTLAANSPPSDMATEIIPGPSFCQRQINISFLRS
jgi:hypothetical protein